MRLLVLPTLAALALALAGCGSSSSSSSSSPPASSSSSQSASSSAPSSGGASPAAGAKTATVAIKNLAFTPSVLHAKVGQTITWTNSDTPPHTVTYVSGPKFASSGTLNTGAMFSVKLTQAGTIAYYCTVHPFMKATIVVSG